MMNPPTMATKWTSAILSRLFALNIAPATRPYPSPTVHTPAYSRSYASASKHLSPEELEQKKKEARLRQLEKLRLRYQTDPEYREKMKQHAKAQRAAISADPELLAKYREMERQRYEDPVVRDKKRQYQRAKYATDSEFRNRRLDKMRQYSKLKFAHDPQVREKSIQAGKNYWQKLKSTLEHDPEAYKLQRGQTNERSKAFYFQDAEYRWGQVVRNRARTSDRFRNMVVWRHHELVLYPTKMDYNCATCGHKKYGGLKTWYVWKFGHPIRIAELITISRWRRKNEPEKYDCFGCFQANREASTPVCFPPEFAPLPVRSPVEQQSGDHEGKENEGNGNGLST
jgi:hypothetical protein